MKLYIAGPMAGHYNFNYDSFNWVARRLRADGNEVINPAELDEYQDDSTLPGEADKENWNVGGKRRAAYLRRDFRHLIECDGLVLLPGWQNSTGANAELWVARTLALLVYRWDDSLQRPDGQVGGGLVYERHARPSRLALENHWTETVLDPAAAAFKAAAIEQIRGATLRASGRRS